MKFSIITVCFNSERTIKDTIDSVLEQTWVNFEILVIDGVTSRVTKLLAFLPSNFPVVELNLI